MVVEGGGMRDIVIACGDYDRTAKLKLGQIPLDGAPYTYLSLTPAEIFWRMHSYAEFDACEMSFATYCVGRSMGDERFLAIPVFPSRTFRHGNVYVREDSAVTQPSQLKGSRVGVSEYGITAAVWIRGFLHDEHGVDAADIEWVNGRQEKIPEIPRDRSISVVREGDKDLEQALLSGEIDALATPVTPARLGQGIRRLIDDHEEAEVRYFERFGIFPIMHTLVIRADVYAEQPWLARSLFKAFSLAKKASDENMYRTNALPYTLPWMIPLIERTRRVMGADPWPYGIEPNRPTLEAFTRHLEEQSLTEGRLAVDDLFLPGEWTNQKL
jgi:4,5-dihydroxyphthalate decarboxylase